MSKNIICHQKEKQNKILVTNYFLGQPFQGEGLPPVDRVVISPGNSGLDLQCPGPPFSGFVLPQQQSQASHLLCIQEGQEGLEDGCDLLLMARDMGICVPPIQHSSDGAGTCSPIRLPDLPHRASMEEASLVPDHPSDALRLSVGHSSTPAPPEDAKHGQVPPGPRVSPPHSLADFELRVQVQGVSDKASELLMAAWRPGTKRVYSSQFRIFSRWCVEWDINPSSPSIPQVLDFLAHLFEEGKQYRTIGVYRSMLSNAIGVIEGHQLGEHPKVIRLLKGVFNSRLPKKSLVPEWDLHIVLNA